MEITPTQDLWISFLSESAGVYTFDLRLCRHLEVENFEKVEQGVEIMGVDDEEWYTFKEGVWNIPQILEDGLQIPKSDMSASWEVPEDLKCDKVFGATLVDPVTYAAEADFPWEVPFFWSARAEFIPVDSVYTEIPASLPDMEKEGGASGGGGASGEWAVFVPEKAQYGLSDYTLDSSDTYWDESWIRWWGLGFFIGCDLNEYHILSTFTRSFPNNLNPYSDNPSSPSQIYTCQSSWNGFDRYYFHSGSLSMWYTKRYTAPAKDIQYYPPRFIPPSRGGLPILLPGVALLNLISNGALGLLTETPIERIFKNLR